MSHVLAFFGGAPGGGEILVILAVALLLFGSKNLPKIARGLGRAMEEFRRATRQVSTEIMHAAHEEDLKSAPVRPAPPVDPQPKDVKNDPAP
ncbi:MAG: twin-arginine translocase TatA/TatE family subunit [Lentisphaerota bacterium]